MNKISFKKLISLLKKEDTLEIEKLKKKARNATNKQSKTGNNVHSAALRYFNNKRKTLLKIFKKFNIDTSLFKKKNEYWFPEESSRFLMDILKKDKNLIISKSIKYIRKKEKEYYNFIINGIISLFNNNNDDIKFKLFPIIIKLKTHKQYLIFKLNKFKNDLISIINLNNNEDLISLNYDNIFDKLAILDYSIQMLEPVLEIIKNIYSKCLKYRENDHEHDKKAIEKLLSKNVDDDNSSTESEIRDKMYNSSKIINKAIGKIKTKFDVLNKPYTPLLFTEYQIDQLEKIHLNKKADKIIFDDEVTYKEPTKKKIYKTR